MEQTTAILVVDDEPDLLENIRMALQSAGYRVLTSANGLEALNVLSEQPVNLIIADIAMPNMNGYQLYETVRQNNQWGIIPFVFLTARDMDSDIRYGKELGVDDYLTKPIHRDDLLAVVRGKLRRAQQLNHTLLPTPNSQPDILAIGPLEIDSNQYKVRFHQKEVKFSAKEFTLLKYLAQNTGTVLSPISIIELTHNFKTNQVEAGALARPLIRTLRRKLGEVCDEQECIETIRGIGYRLNL